MFEVPLYILAALLAGFIFASGGNGTTPMTLVDNDPYYDDWHSRNETQSPDDTHEYYHEDENHYLEDED